MGLYERLLQEKSAVPEEDRTPLEKEYPPRLYGRLLKERDDEEKKLGHPLGYFHGLDSAALDRALQGRGGGMFSLQRMYYLMRQDGYNLASRMLLYRLKHKYEREYAEIKAEMMGQRECSFLLQEILTF